MSIELKSVSYTYSPNTPYSSKALDNISLTIDTGEYIGIIGKTGCGKSTLVQIIDGLINADSGSVLFDGQDINKKSFDRSVLRKNIGMVFQFPEYQLFETTVEKDVAFALKHSRLSKTEIRCRVKESLEAVGFDYDKIKDKSPLSLSGGEKRRAAIAGVLVSKPNYLILDEAIAGLDPLGKTKFMDLIDRLNEMGTAIIMISHNTDIIAEHTSRVLLMNNGKILRDGKTTDVLSDYDMLVKSGINPCQVSNIAEKLRNNGVQISDSTIKYNQLIEEICRTYKGGCI
ncbi:MAG: ATP-binding cassette domain-containing protein [Acetobacter sp.]|nr:ATP-binding cassette domain-containing protein [Bacteroides sp.]MCM1341082.1 ATP-binding cassette domain-containing protein [Acetobacter sp.]MCM1433585.1 ATP-binding cassette domain-containing protein [Clostridiales bacterium]